ncbi:MAG: TetR/AcrR family transcriptional regulator [Actinomycetota bacterium]
MTTIGDLAPEGTDADAGLPGVLCNAAAEVIIEKGLGAFSLREVARRAGVSHAAPGYHFGDLRGLLTALATQGMQALGHDMTAASASTDDPAERLAAIGRAYVRLAVANPAHCQVIWREDLIDVEHIAYQEAGMVAYGVLEDTIRAIAEHYNPDLEIHDAAKLCWSTMQGLVELQPKLSRIDEIDGDAVPVEDMVDRFTPMLVAGMAAAMPVQPAAPSDRS